MPEYDYTIELLPPVKSDVSEIIARFIMFGSENGAKRIREKLTKTLERIRFQPYSGVAAADKSLAKAGFRVVVVERYLIFYKVFENEKKVSVYRILNGKTNYITFLKRHYN